MKNAKNILAAVMMTMTIATYANANTNIDKTVEGKANVNGAVYALPETLPVLESPAPQSEKISNGTNKLNAEQKAAIVGLKLKSQLTK